MTDASVVTPTRTIAIISSQYLVCLGLQNILERGKTGCVVQSHQRMPPDLLLPQNHPDVFVLDLETDRQAVWTIRQIQESAPNSKIVLLSGMEDRQRLHEAFACGVDGVILKVQPPAVVLATIEALYPTSQSPLNRDRNGVVEKNVKKLFQQEVESEPHSPTWPEAVTEREREVIRLVRQGLSNKEIADRLCIADSTVRHHLTNIFDKVGVPNRQKLLVHAHQVRATPP